MGNGESSVCLYLHQCERWLLVKFKTRTCQLIADLWYKNGITAAIMHYAKEKVYT